MEDKFIIYASHRSDASRKIILSEETYSLLQQIKAEVHMPLSALAEKAIMYALERVEIRKDVQNGND